MALKGTRKKKTVRVARRKTGFAAMPTDDFQKSKHYVQYETETREWLDNIKEYCKKTLDKKQMQALNQIPDWKIGFGAHWAVCAYYLNNDITVPEPYLSAFTKRINNMIEEGTEILKKTKKSNKAEPVNIQQRIFQQSMEICEPIEEWLENYVENPKSFDPAAFDVDSHFKIKQVSQAHARKIKNFYQPLLEEVDKIIDLPSQAKIAAIKDEKERDLKEQLKEGYSHIKRPQALLYKQALEKLVGSCDLIIDGAKAKRAPRKRRVPSKEKLVANVKYCESDSKYQIASVNPLDILDSKEIWVFNIKTRKLGKYIADETSGTMTVKGTTIQGFDEDASIQKTLRKPEETLKEFKSAGKIKLRKFMEEIKTTDTKMNGRLNTDIVILKAIK